MISMLLTEERFSHLSADDKQFIITFTRELAKRGYTFGGRIHNGYYPGQLMLVYCRERIKTKIVAARLYIDKSGLTLRLFLHKAHAREQAALQAPLHIRKYLTGSEGSCTHCKGENCHFIKRNSLMGKLHEKCNGHSFCFPQPNLDDLPEYLALFSAFNPTRV